MWPNVPSSAPPMQYLPAPTSHPYLMPPQASYMPPPAYARSGAPDEIRTIFITGFPQDIKERELNNLCRFLPGYIASQMNWQREDGPAHGFAVFSAAQMARQACEMISQLMFDEGSVLKCEMARNNMHVPQEMAAASVNPYYGHQGTSASASQAKRPRMNAGGAAGGSMPNNDNPPCNTLYIGNLGDNINEHEIIQTFGGYPGYKQIKLCRGPPKTSCFVEYEDTSLASVAHASLQGTLLPSNDRGGLRVQYSKNPLGKKRTVD